METKRNPGAEVITSTMRNPLERSEGKSEQAGESARRGNMDIVESEEPEEKMERSQRSLRDRRGSTKRASAHTAATPEGKRGRRGQREYVKKSRPRTSKI